jgi:hypothetical protein
VGRRGIDKERNKAGQHEMETKRKQKMYKKKKLRSQDNWCLLYDSSKSGFIAHFVLILPLNYLPNIMLHNWPNLSITTMYVGTYVGKQTSTRLTLKLGR